MEEASSTGNQAGEESGFHNEETLQYQHSSIPADIEIPEGMANNAEEAESLDNMNTTVDMDIIPPCDPAMDWVFLDTRLNREDSPGSVGSSPSAAVSKDDYFDDFCPLESDIASRSSNSTHDSQVDQAAFRARGMEFDEEWKPYGWKQMFLACLLMNLAKHRIPQSVLELIWWIFKELDVTMPALSAVKQMQKSVLKNVGSLMQKCTTTESKKICYYLDLFGMISREIANPEVITKLHTFPDDTPSAIGELWQAGKWHNVAQFQSPMVRTPNGDFWINECAATSTGQLFRLLRFAYYDQVLTVYAHPVIQSPSSSEQWVDERQIADPSLCDPSYWDYDHRQPKEPGGPPREWPLHLPPTLWEKAGGRRVIVVPLVLFCDDTSGNRSKRFNPHESWFVQLAGLPFADQQDVYHIHFVCTSNEANGIEMADRLVEQIAGPSSEGFVAFDGKAQESVYVVCPLLVVTADNPMHSHLGAHIGMTGNSPCRFCKVKGSLKNQRDCEALMQLGEPGTTLDTQRTLVQYVNIAPHPGKKTLVGKLQTESGIKCRRLEPVLEQLYEFAKGKPSPDGIAARISQLGCLEQHMSAFFRVPAFDVHADMPIEVLHTVLLGPVKYLLRDTLNNRISTDDKVILETRLRSMDTTTGFYRPLVVSQIMQHVNSLVGKDFKHFVQIAPFVLHDLVTPDVLDVWMSLANLVQLVFRRRYDANSGYLAEVDKAVRRVLSHNARLSLRWLNKPKFHLLLHLPACIERHGPAIIVATERFESNNHGIRDASYHSNRQAPSRDIGHQYDSRYVVQHVASGGYWLDKDGHWVAGGGKLVKFGKLNAVQLLLGEKDESGNINSPTRYVNKRTDGNWTCDQIIGGDLLNSSDLYPSTSVFIRWRWFMSKSNERCKTDAFVLCHDKMPLIRSFMLWKSSAVSRRPQQSVLAAAFVTTGIIVVGSSDEDRSEMTIIKVSSVVGPVSVVHDCQHAQCRVTKTRQVRMERELSIENFGFEVAHRDTDRYIVNTFCLRTYWAWEAFPVQLPPPKPLDMNQAYVDYLLDNLQRQARGSRPRSRASQNSSIAPSVVSGVVSE
ncbi:hypothetical protein DFS34DRAFT_671836 [Phlyctochytrium arcticum]|nr:hypothetical protein DFS34DRAFT_671836 [Phlyctochytrium arcticum]